MAKIEDTDLIKLQLLLEREKTAALERAHFVMSLVPKYGAPGELTININTQSGEIVRPPEPPAEAPP